jgi:MFS family permease
MVEPVTEPGDQRSSLFRDRLSWYLGVSVYWFATSFKWFILLQLMPLLVNGVVPPQEKDLWWGRISGLGAIEAMIGPALFGYMSDRLRCRYGRRQPFIAIGAALTAITLLFLASADRLWMFFAGYVALQISDDVATGPYAALVPDHVPEERRGRASGILGQLQLLAQIVAAGVALALTGRPDAILWTIAGVNLSCALIVIATLREGRLGVVIRPSDASVKPASSLGAGLVRVARAWMATWHSADFRWVWFTRFLNALGFYVILDYLLFYLQDSVRTFRLPGLALPGPFEASIFLSLIISLAGAVSAVWAGNLADRIGRKRIIYLAGWLMFVTLVPFALIPTYWVIVLLSPVFGIGYGAYLSTTWALAADILLNREDAAKDMGIWQMSIAAPQVVAGFFVSVLINQGNLLRPGLGYTFAFLFAAGAFLAGSVLVRFVRGST